jgi:hypothetical protein
MLSTVTRSQRADTIIRMIYERFEKRPLSHSQLASWEYDKEQWYTNYILGERSPATPAMKFGSIVGDSIGTKDSLVPDLQPPGVKEYKLEAMLGEIPMIGFCDHYCDTKLILHENKTSDNPKRWTQKKVDAHTQLDMYLLLLFIAEKIKPEEVQVFLNFIPVKRGGDMKYTCPGEYIQFETKRTMADLLRYGQYVNNTIQDMQSYINEKQRS